MSLINKYNLLWKKIEKKFFNKKFQFIHNFDDSSSRVYFCDNIIFKISLKNVRSINKSKLNNLFSEYKILKKLKDLKFTPQVKSYSSFKEFEVLRLYRINGHELKFSELINPIIFGRLIKCIYILAKKGISHNDLLPRNIIVSKNNKISLIDFDQASSENFFKAILMSYFFIFFRQKKYYKNNLLNMFKYFLTKKISNETIVRFKRFFYPSYFTLPNKKNLKSDELKKLLQAWKIAAKSNASSPGINIAYYSFDFEGVHFPGERGWKERWKILNNITNFNKKKILELGCNMGLLSSHIKFHNPSCKILGIDHDKNIIKSAKIISEALNVDCNFKCVDIDKDIEKNEYKNFDIIFCLNVLNWVKNKSKLLNFLKNSKELIFEGHDNYKTEKARLRSIGFKKIKLVINTERNRPLIHCKK